MSNLLFYRDFYGSVVYNSEEDTLQGKIEGIEDLITYEERSLSKIKIEFKNYVDGYIETCESVGKHHGKSNLAEAIMCESCKPMYRFIDNFIKKLKTKPIEISGDKVYELYKIKLGEDLNGTYLKMKNPGLLAPGLVPLLRVCAQQHSKVTAIL